MTNIALPAQASSPLCSTWSPWLVYPLRPRPWFPTTRQTDSGILRNAAYHQTRISHCCTCPVCADVMLPQQTVCLTPCSSRQVNASGLQMLLGLLSGHTWPQPQGAFSHHLVSSFKWTDVFFQMDRTERLVTMEHFTPLHNMLKKHESADHLHTEHHLYAFLL